MGREGANRVAVVFISYERSAEATARKVGEALAASGYEPWSDALLPPHRDYTKVIEERLESADVVLVLWSEAAVESQWVRAEANYARERNKLVQVTLDGAIPPMPFNQIHCASLAHWRGSAKDHEWQMVLGSLGQLCKAPDPTPLAAHGGHDVARQPAHRRPLAWLIAGLAAVAIIAGGLWLARGLFWRAPAPDAARIAVLPFDALSSSPDARFFADALADQIATTLSDNHIQVVSHDDAITLRGPDRDKRLVELDVGYLLDGTVQNDGKQIKATVHLDDPGKHVTLWSGDVEGPADQAPLLQTRLATTIVSMLACSKRALSPAHGLTDPALLTRYLHACDFMSLDDPRKVSDLMTTLREVAAGAPDFAPAHSDLAMYGSVLSASLPTDAAGAMRREAAREAARALALDPKSADAYVALGKLAEPDHAKSEQLLRTAVAVDPASGNANAFLAGSLASDGRLHEADQFSQTAASVDLQLDWSEQAAWMACMDGQASRGAYDLAARQRQNPTEQGGLWYDLYQCLQVAGRWDDALALASDQAHRPPAAGAWNPVEAAYLRAGKTRSPADLAKARPLLLAQPGDNAAVLFARMCGQASLGFVDDAFNTADRWASLVGRRIDGAAFLFEPLTAPMRHDPRFMQLAARQGLVDFWRTSGHWPDFCGEPTLPYNCKAVAAQLQSVSPAKA